MKEEKTMKYTNLNIPFECMQTQNFCYKNTTTMNNIKGILWHSTKANDPFLKRYIQPSDNDTNRNNALQIIGKNFENNDWNRNKELTNFHAWVGYFSDKSIGSVQTMPWIYKSNGCGVGSKGSCNSGWIQLIACEDNLSDPEYFNKIYQEICELTAYLCIEFNINPKGVVDQNGIAVPTILCHQEAYKLRLAENDTDILHWLIKYGKDMEIIRNDVVDILEATKEVEEISLTDDSIEIESTPKNDFQIGDIVKIKENSKYYSKKVVPSWIFQQEWIVSNIADERVTVNKSTSTKSAINSDFHYNDLILVDRPKKTENKAKYKIRKDWDDNESQKGIYNKKENAIEACKKIGNGYSVFDTNGNIIFTAEASTTEDEPKLQTTLSSTSFKPYVVRILNDELNVRGGPSTKHKINSVVKKNQLYTIVAEKNGWGKLKSGAGWISLNYTKKIK